ncbi:MAG: GntR family transcriptional regulator [Conexibacter sp.]
MTFPETGGGIEPVSTVEAIRRALEQLAYSGPLAAGTPLREHDLAERFAVGRHSVRAALSELVRDGIAIHEPNRGVFARHFSLEQIADIYHLRGAVETEAVRAIHDRRLPRHHVDAALAQLARLERGAEVEDMVVAGVGVHRAIVAEPESPRLLRAFDSMLRALRVALAQAQVAVEPETPAAVLREHRQLVDDIWTLPRAAAVERIRAHTAESMDGVIAAIGL